MTTLFLDAFTLACPTTNVIPDHDDFCAQFEDYVSRVSCWGFLRSASWASVWIGSDTFLTLQETACYPLWQPVRDALEKCGLTDIYQAKDIVNVVEAILNKSHVINDALGVSDILCEFSHLEPSNEIAKRHHRFVTHLEQLVALIAVRRALEKTDESEIVISNKIPTTSVQILARGVVHECEMYADRSLPDLAMPHNFEISLPLCCSIQALDNILDPLELWTKSSILSEYKKCLQVFACQRYGISHEEFSHKNCKDWIFGKDFIKTARQLGFLADSTKIRALLNGLVDAVCDENPRQVHPLREGKGPNDPHKKRGSDRAFRRDVDHEFHLHYWSTGSGIEFASVVVHNNFSIPE